MTTRVTVVDDDADLLDVFREILQDAGFVVETRSGALPGIQDLIRSKPDLIIVDMLLDPHREELTGLQLIHSARTSEALRDVPIIVCTSDLPGLNQAWPELEARGDVHKLDKPFDLSTFERVVSMALGRPIAANGFGGTRIVEAGGIAGAERTEQEG